MGKIDNYYQINDRVATSGQPTEEQFQMIADAGYKVVINLALSTSTNAIPNESEIVADLGMMYFQIPVVWEAPTVTDVELFFKMMRSFKKYPVWVHCAKNMRVSCFIYFWQKYELGMSEEDAMHPMKEIWQPTKAWQELIAEIAVLNQ